MVKKSRVLKQMLMVAGGMRAAARTVKRSRRRVPFLQHRAGRGNFWSGFAVGAATVVGGSVFAMRLQRGGSSRILRLEKSIQIASSVHDVWETWSDLHALSAMSDSIRQVRAFGDRSRWTADVNGVPVEWEAEITQVAPYQAIGWKSVTGPKHSGRVTFSQIGNDTLVHVRMNYAPPVRLLRRFLAPFSGDLEGYVEKVLREVKAGLESRGSSGNNVLNEAQATGTYGPGPELLTDKQNTRFGGPTTPMESTRPPRAKS